MKKLVLASLLVTGCKWIHPTPPPVPVNVSLPSLYKIHKGDKVALQVRPQEGLTFKWSTGETTPLIWVTPTVDTTYGVYASSATSSAYAQTTVVVE